MDDPPPILGAARASAAGDARYVALFLAALSVIAGAIHVEAAAAHAGALRAYSGLFAALAVTQLAWAVCIYRSPARGRLAAGVALSAAVVLVWLVSRTAGVPFGPEAWSPEQPGPLDVAATLDEAAIAVIGLRILRLGRWPVFDARDELLLYGLMTLTAATLFLGGQVH
jgi:hypothetical protein